MINITFFFSIFQVISSKRPQQLYLPSVLFSLKEQLFDEELITFSIRIL